jgi:hypothetical protein
MNTNAYKEYFDIYLPKWPGVLVIGDPITREQAAEVIIRTDSLYFSSNDREFEKLLNKEIYGVEADTMNLTDAITTDILRGIKGTSWERAWSYKDDKTKEVGKIQLEYMNNSRILSAWIGGPHGWCDWNGNIGSRNYNIGKHPSVEQVYKEWVKIAKEFPFLNLRCQLLNHEIGCEDSVEDPKPQIEFVIKKGKVKVLIPLKTMVQGEFGSDDMMNRFNNRYAERGCSIEKFKEALNQVKEKFKTNIHE